MGRDARTKAQTKRRGVGLLAALLASVALEGITLPGTGWAQTAGTQGTRQFNIPAQALTDALVQFGYQSGLQVAADGNVAASVRSAAVSGTYTPAEALGRMLAGTGLTFQFTGATTIQVQRVANLPPGVMQLDPVQVQGAFPVPPQAMIDNLPPPYAGGQVATGGQLGLLGNRPVMDTPFNQTSYTAQKGQDQQAKTVRDVLIDDPSVRSNRADGATGVDGVYIRGFNFTNLDFAYGGLYGMLPRSSIMVELAERVEVLKGPSAMLNGMSPLGSIAGMINIVPKRAPDAGLTQVTANYTSAGQYGGHVDLARRFGSEEEVGVRFNGVFRAGQTDVQWNSDERALALLGMDFRGERVRLSADLGYQYQNLIGLIPALGVANNVPLPWAPDARKNQGQPWTTQERMDLFGVFRAEFDLTERITAYAAFGAHDFRFGTLDLSGGRLTVTSFYGNTTTTPINQSIYETTLTGEVGVRALVDTGPIAHEFAVSGTTFAGETGNVLINGTAFATNIYNPTVIARPNIPTPAATKTSTQGLSGLGLADTLSVVDKRLQLTVGGRFQRVEAANFNATTGARTSNYDQSAFSPSVALVVKPWQNVSVYGNWIQGLQQGVIVGPQFTNAGEVFPPFKSTQYEAGVKVDWGKLTTTASVFQISQPFTFADVSTNTLVLGGEQRNQGLEFNVFGEPAEGVRLLGGFMLLNAVLAKTQGGLTDGWIAPFSPGFNLNLAGEWDLPFARGLTLTGRAVYTGSQYIDTTWPRRNLPEWMRFDLGLRYAFDNPGAPGKLLVARVNVDNVLDANYWAGGTAVTLLNLGAPRTFRLSLTADF